MLKLQAANKVEATSPNSCFIHVMERRETDKGDPDHPEERTEVSLCELPAKSLLLGADSTKGGEQRCLPAAGCKRKPLAHHPASRGGSHTPLTSWDEGLPRRAPHARKINRKKARGEASCCHSLPAPLTQSSPTAAVRERTQPAASRDAPPDRAKQQASSSPGEQADNWRGFNSISPQAWTRTEGLVIKLFLVVAMGTQATQGCRLIYIDENNRSGPVSARMANQPPKLHRWRKCHLWQVMTFPPH